MVPQILPPGVEHGEKADLRAEILGIARDGGQCLRRCVEENAVDRLRIVKGDLGDLIRDSEDHMEVFDRQQFGLAAFDPFGALGILTLGAVPVPA
jgi:hypothetical protein